MQGDWILTLKAQNSFNHFFIYTWCGWGLSQQDDHFHLLSSPNLFVQQQNQWPFSCLHLFFLLDLPTAPTENILSVGRSLKKSWDMSRLSTADKRILICTHFHSNRSVLIYFLMGKDEHYTNYVILTGVLWHRRKVQMISLFHFNARILRAEA